MSVIFDLKQSGNAWAHSINAALETDCPQYLEVHGAVGSDKWWQHYDRGNIPSKKKKGVVTFIGKRLDFFNEEYETVEIDQDGQLVEYDHLGYWVHNEISVGAIVVVEYFKIRVNQKYGPMVSIFERLVEVL